jgi:hypothetical protein
MRSAILMLAMGCASTPERPAAPRGVTYDRDRVDGTLAHIVDQARAGRSGRAIHEHYGEQFVTGLDAGVFTVTVWAEPEREVTPSRVADAVERSGGVALEGAEGVVRARLTLEQVGALSRDPAVRMLRLARHRDPIR